MKYAKPRKVTFKKRINKKPYKKKSMVRFVKKIVQRQQETKMNDTEIATKTIYGYIDGTTFSSLLPSSILHGTGEGARIGNRINCTNLYLRMSVYCFNQASLTPPIYFDMYIYKIKASVPNPPTNAQYVNFLEDGNTSTQYTGNVLDGLRKVNDELFTPIMHKRFLMFNPLNSSNHLGATASLNPSRTFKINLTKHIKKTWIYNDNFGTIQNDTLFLSIACTLSDGTTLPLTTTFGTYSYVVEASFKDA